MATVSGGRHRAPVVAVEAADADRSDSHEAVLTAPVEMLVEAILSVSADLDLDGVLRRTVQAACILTGARHGMVAVDGERAILYGERGPDEGPLTAACDGLVASLRVGHVPYARLHLAPAHGGRGFTAVDHLMVERLAVAAGQAIGNALAHHHARESETVDEVALDDEVACAVTAERERIARDLHDSVIQRLFATGLQMQALRRTLGEEAAAGIAGSIRDLDATMRDLRATVYGLRRPRRVSVLGQVEALVREYSAGLGFRPRIEHSGPIDELLEGDLGDHVLATLRESLSNIAKHARASAATVELHVSPQWTMLRVTDNGVGIPQGEHGVLGSGLANLRVRAERLGGLLRISGNGLAWIVPTGR